MKHTDLAGLPEELIQAMRHAVEEGDMIRMKELIARVEKANAGAAYKLKILAEQYDYDKLRAVLK